MLTGRCFSGAIHHEADGAPFRETNCHCSICRRATGAPFLSMFSVRSIEFRIIKGQPDHLASLVPQTVSDECVATDLRNQRPFSPFLRLPRHECDPLLTKPRLPNPLISARSDGLTTLRAIRDGWSAAG